MVPEVVRVETLRLSDRLQGQHTLRRFSHALGTGDQTVQIPFENLQPHSALQDGTPRS